MLLTREQLAGRKEKAVRFVRDVLGDPERAEEIEAESLDAYARRRRIELANPKKGVSTMPATTRQQLQEELDQLQEAIDNAHETLSDVYSPEATRGALARAIGEAIDILEALATEEETDHQEGAEEEEEEE